MLIQFSDQIELEINLEISTFGNYRPMTRFEPEENPEIEFSISDIWFKNKLVENINPKNLELIENLIKIEINNTNLEELL